MELVWGTKTAPENAWITRTDDAGQQASCFSNVGFLERVYLAFFDPASVKSPCPYTAEFLLSPLDGRGDKDVAKMATHRVIFYGGALQGAQDKVYTPVNDLLAVCSCMPLAMEQSGHISGQAAAERGVAWRRRDQRNLVQIIATFRSF